MRCASEVNFLLGRALAISAILASFVSTRSPTSACSSCFPAKTDTASLPSLHGHYPLHRYYEAIRLPARRLASLLFLLVGHTPCLESGQGLPSRHDSVVCSVPGSQTPGKPRQSCLIDWRSVAFRAEETPSAFPLLEISGLNLIQRSASGPLPCRPTLEPSGCPDDSKASATGGSAQPYQEGLPPSMRHDLARRTSSAPPLPVYPLSAPARVPRITQRWPMI